jgi:hypothetical protein
MQSILTPWALLTATGALLAFQIGLYTLVGRERKAPYVINSVFWLFLLCLVAAAFDICAALLQGSYQEWLLLSGAALLLVAVVYTACVVYRIAIRFVYFIDDPHPKHWPGIRQVRAWWSWKKVEPTYSHHTLPITDELKRKIAEVLEGISENGYEDRDELGRRSLAVAVEHQGQGNRLLAQLAAIFIKNNHSVQYTTASRHPIEFVELLKSELEKSGEEWLSRKKQIVVVDAYTPHFGFIDSIYRIKTRELQELGVTCIRSHRTYAGMHTASSRAFKKIKAQLKQDERHPTLVIYEDCYALSDLESAEQYRIFIRHVLPSERMWDGMFSVFVESAIPEWDWRTLQAYASMKLDLRKKDLPSASKPSSRGVKR